MLLQGFVFNVLHYYYLLLLLFIFYFFLFSDCRCSKKSQKFLGICGGLYSGSQESCWYVVLHNL